MKTKDYFIILVPILLMFMAQWISFEHRLTKVETKLDLLTDSRGVFNEGKNFRH